MSLDPDAASLLSFWFGTAHVAGPVDPSNMGRWFRPDPAFDAELLHRFGPLVTRAARGELSAWEETAPGALARVLLLDQLPRNLYRDDARAFEADPLARAAADRAVTHRYDCAVSTLARGFFYLPFEHAEELVDQHRAVQLFEALANDAPPELAEAAKGMYDYALKHRAVIERFGRFPHRNAALGRASTPEESAFLESGRGF